MYRIVTLFLAFVLLTITGTACSTPQVDLPKRDVPITEEAAKSLEEKIASLKAAPNGDIKIQVTESEVTSYINLRLVQKNLPLQKPTIWFSAGKVYLKGRLEAEGIPVKGDAILVVTLSVQDGRIHLQVEKAIIGRVPVPQSVLTRLSTLANEHLTTLTGPIPVKELQILEGEAILILSRQP